MWGCNHTAFGKRTKWVWLALGMCLVLGLWGLQGVTITLQWCPPAAIDPLKGRWIATAPRPGSNVRDKLENEPCLCPEQVVYARSISSPTEQDGASRLLLSDLFQEGKTEGMRVLRTVTTPSFLIVLGPEGEEVSRVIQELGHFGPAATIIFHNILEERCRQRDKNGLSPLVIDVGAHVGYFALYAAAMGCRVLAVEPTSGPSKFLGVSLSLNSMQHFVQLLDVVVGQKSGTVAFTALPPPAWAFNHMVLDTGNEEGVPKQLVALDDVIAEDVLLLKIDASGYEDEVLKGLTQTIQKYNIDNILCETKPVNDKAWKARFMNEMRQGYGYHLLLYQEWYLTEQWKAAGKLNTMKEVLAGNSLPGISKRVDSLVDSDSWLFGFEEVWYTKNSSLMYQLSRE